MGAPVLDSAGRAVVFDRETGEVHHWPVPTALENVTLSGGRYVHGETGERVKPTEKAVEPEAEPAIELREEGVLDLPQPEPEPEAEPAAEPEAELSPAQVAALDHDGDGKAGGSKPRKATGGFAARAAK